MEFVCCSSVAVNLWKRRSNNGSHVSKMPGQIFVPLRATAEALGVEVTWDEKTQQVGIGTVDIPDKEFVYLYNDTKLVPIRIFERVGAAVIFDEDKLETTVSLSGKDVQVKLGAKRVEVSINDQKLRAWQGDILVMETNVSTGKRGHSTPRGKFKTVQQNLRCITPDSIIIRQCHGACRLTGMSLSTDITVFASRPASHGCIRMPLRGKNAARYFYVDG